MIKCNFFFCKLIPAIFVLPVFFSCNNNSANIPFPGKEFGYTQPVAVPLHFSTEKKLTWDTVKKGGIHPVIKKLDIEVLPSTPYDTTGFKAFNKAPEEVKFDFDHLPDTAFSLDALPSKPLQFKTSLLPPPAFIKTMPPSVQKGNPLSISDFGPKQGLPASFVTALLKDRNGLMWIGSREGLFRYDGNQYQNYIPGGPKNFMAGMAEDDFGRIWFIDQLRVGMIDPFKGTISYTPIITVNISNICKIIKDKEGRIWISKTTAKEVIIIDPARETYKSLSRSSGLSDTGGANDILEDNNRNIWITTPYGGADIINLKTKKIKYLKKTNGLENDSLRAIATDQAGQIWIAFASGIVDAINVQKGTIKHYNEKQGLRTAIFTSLLSVDNKGRIWIGKNLGLEVLDPENGRNRFIDDTRGLGVAGLRFVTSCTMDNNKRMWVSTVGGLHIIDQNAETVYPVGVTNIISLMEDTIGNLWIATQEGVKIIDTKKSLTRRLDKANGLGDNFVQTVSKFNQQMWVTSDGGLDIVDPLRKSIEHMGKNEGLINDTIYVALKDKAGNIWITGPSNGIDLIDASKQTILHTDVAGGLNDNNIVDAREDEDGLIWLGSNSGGINVVDFKNSTVKYLNTQPGLKDTCSKMMLVDHYGRIWIGTDKGLYVADKKEGTITAITMENGLPSNRILSLLEYQGRIIAGTSKKVSIITAPTPAYAKIGKDTSQNKWDIALMEKSAGLTREVTNSWSTDGITHKGEYLWGDNGITVIHNIEADKQNPPIYITGMNLMNKPQYFANKILLIDKDSLWVGDSVFVKGQPIINAGYSDIKTFTWDSVSAPYNMPEHLSIPYNKNYIQFQFTAAHLSIPEPTLYTYVLEGIDKNWSIPSTSMFTENYLNLPPGKYTFKVCSKGINGSWSTPASFSFTIAPPWYKTWWAYTLYALLFAGVLRAYIVFRSRRLQRENKLLEEKISLRTRQLQDSIEDLKATQSQLVQSEKMASLGELTAGIAHEIQNPLNFINNFSEVNTELIEEMKTELKAGNTDGAITIAGDIAANEQKINHHGKRADSIVKGMLQHSRSSNGIKEPTNINALAEEYLRLAYHGLRAKDKSFNAVMKTDFDESIGNINIIPQDIGRVILNLITNAFYVVTEKKQNLQLLPNLPGQVPGGNETYEPKVTVSTRRFGSPSGDGGVEIRVADNGNGIPPKVLEKIFQPFFTTKPAGQGTGLGLSMSYDIVTKGHGGELKVETKEGEGAAFIIFLPNKS